MTIKLIERIMISALIFVAITHMVEAAEQLDMQETELNSKWTMIVNEEAKPLGEFSPFISLRPDNESQIIQIRFDICPYETSIANIFSDVQHQNNSSIGISAGPSLIGLCVKASHDTDFNKAKGIVDSINSQVQSKFEKKRANYEVGSKEYLLMKYTRIKLPFIFYKQEQPHCFYATLELNQHEYLRDFIEEFQNVFLELGSEYLDYGYMELVRRIPNDT